MDESSVSMSAALVQLPRPASMAARSIIRRSSRVSARPALSIHAWIASIPSRSMIRLVATLSLTVIISVARSLQVGWRPGASALSTPVPSTDVPAGTSVRASGSRRPASAASQNAARIGSLMRLADGRITRSLCRHVRPVSRCRAARATSPVGGLSSSSRRGAVILAVALSRRYDARASRPVKGASMILALLLAAVLTVSVASPVAAQAPKKGGTLVVGMSQDLPGLDPHPSTSTITYQVLSLVYQGLVDFDRDLKIRPVLAESWTTSADGKQWTFKLRKGVKFHNGRALAASDVKFSLDRILD